jgi:hypothetical protein
MVLRSARNRPAFRNLVATDKYVLDSEAQEFPFRDQPPGTENCLDDLMPGRV